MPGQDNEEEDVWARYWVEPGTDIEDPRELRRANLAIFRAELLKSVEGNAPTTDQLRNAQVLVHHSVAAILESNGQYADSRDGAHGPIQEGQAGYVNLKVNNRFFSVPTGAFPVFHALRAQRQTQARPLGASQDWSPPPLPKLTNAQIDAVLELAEEALGWVAD